MKFDSSYLKISGFQTSGWLFAFITIVLFGCTKDPQASFQNSYSEININESLSLTNTSVDAAMYVWNFGDGATSTEENPVHTYTKPGTYVIELRAISENDKKSDNYSELITVNDYDPCASVFCLHGGTCNEGACQCPDRYEGEDCRLQKTPTKLRVTKVEVSRFPAKNNGDDWDQFGRPDIYPVLTKKLNGVELWNFPSMRRDDADATFSYDFTPTAPIDLDEPEATYLIGLYDYDDTSDDDYMGGVYFTPYYSTNDFPDIITVDGGGGVAFKLHVVYNF